jgi:membrane-associated HD superfamily phosphohydrolase
MSFNEFSNTSIYVVILYFVINLILTWAVGLALPLLLRFIILRKKVSKNIAILIAIFNFFIMIFVFRYIFHSQNKTYLIEIVVGYVAYRIMLDRTENKKRRCCSYCGLFYKESDAMHICDTCGASYHKKCFDLHDGCANLCDKKQMQESL